VSRFALLGRILGLFAAFAVVGGLAVHDADAAPLRARDTADVLNKGSWSVGVFNPVEYSLSDTFALRGNIWPVGRYPVVDVRHALLKGSWRVSGEYGLGLPGLALGGATPLGVKGDMFPACKVAAHDASQDKWCLAPGFTVVPRLGVVASTGDKHVTTARLDVQYGLALSGDRGQPLDAFPPLDLAWASATNGWKVRVGGRYDRAITDRIRATGEANFHLAAATPAPERSPWTLSAHLGADIGVGSHSRFTIGVMWFNSDQRATELIDKGGYVVREAVRSNDFYPTIDFIWAG